MKKLFLSTAIDYVNAPAHLGHALEKTQADVLARYHRTLGEEVFFLTGTDENSLKNVRAANKEGIPIQDFVDRNSKNFYALKEALNLSFDDFIRTTETRHKEGVQKLWQACQKDIYKKKYKGLYCSGCEEFYKERELENGLCPEHRVKPEVVEEENYFFKLSRYQQELQKFIEKDKLQIIPQSRKNEVLSFINQGLEDICISRSVERAQGWGIEVPGDPSQISWVWLDALSNYINALGYAKDGEKFKHFWLENNNKLHVIGKGILRFHAIYWPAFLLSAKLPLPDKIFVHGYITVAGEKMAKSVGNVVDPFELVEKYGTDAVRYFLLREIPPTEDGDFTYDKFKERYNADLASGLGNLVARVLVLANKFIIRNSEFKIQNLKLKKSIERSKKDSKKTLEDFRFNEALAAIWGLISFCDRYIEKEKPWEAGDKQKEVIADLLFALQNIAELLQPFLPQTSEKILRQIETQKFSALFPRLK